eukprot:CAMPEP_0177759338 /NCGR_PEP_ID=MMETSP0491_2-20121128/4680_1 /TAXON_ID=63592 /ORGANISM="Tetraselmis chuii, Strain PLY429" /LENGTH=497 /DNA_ID=CAMNT_0019275163 /DNA_START=480 /DNA_END=1973 /DNA_ORIENTATION=+
MQDPVGMNSALFHVACPFTGQAQCCCPHGSSFAQAVQQRGLSGNGAKQLFEMWRDRIPQAQSRYSNAHSPVVGSTELMMPRLYRNPKSMEANNDLPVKVGGEMISKNQAAARLAKATVEAKALAGHAAELAAAAGQTFQVPAELEVDTSGLKSPEDLPILKKIASGAIVERAKRGELSDLEEQQLLGLTSDDYCALRGMQVPGAMGQQPPGMTQPAHAQQQPNRTSEDDAPSRDGMNTLRMKEIRASLKGKTLLVKLPQTSTWERALVHALDLKNRVAKLAFAGASTLIDVDLTQAIRDRVIAWEGDRPEARPSDAGEGQGMPGRSFSGGMGPQPSEPPPQQQQYTPQQLAMMQQYKQQQQQQQQQQQYKQMTYQGQQGQMMQPRMTMQGGYSSPSGGNPSTSMPRNQQGGDMYQQRPSFNQGSVMELLLNMGQRAVGLAVEIHSQSSQHSRKGVVRMVVPQQLCIVVQFGGVSTPLKASDEFREFTIRILQDNSGR